MSIECILGSSTILGGKEKHLDRASQYHGIPKLRITSTAHPSQCMSFFVFIVKHNVLQMHMYITILQATHSSFAIFVIRPINCKMIVPIQALKFRT